MPNLGTAITSKQYDALIHLIQQYGKENTVLVHRDALDHGGWSAPGPDLSTLNDLSIENLKAGLENGWDIIPNPESDAARQQAVARIAKNGIYGVMATPAHTDIPKTLTISYEQQNAVEAALACSEHNLNALVSLQEAMLNNGGWSSEKRKVLNTLSPADIRGIYSKECHVTVLAPRPVVLEQNRNGYPLTTKQVKAIEDWFATPENRNEDREGLLGFVRIMGYPDELLVIQEASLDDLAVILYVGYKPVDE